MRLSNHVLLFKSTDIKYLGIEMGCAIVLSYIIRNNLIAVAIVIIIFVIYELLKRKRLYLYDDMIMVQWYLNPMKNHFKICNTRVVSLEWVSGAHTMPGSVRVAYLAGSAINRIEIVMSRLQWSRLVKAVNTHHISIKTLDN